MCQCMSDGRGGVATCCCLRHKVCNTFWHVACSLSQLFRESSESAVWSSQFAACTFPLLFIISLRPAFNLLQHFPLTKMLLTFPGSRAYFPSLFLGLFNYASLWRSFFFYSCSAEICCFDFNAMFTLILLIESTGLLFFLKFPFAFWVLQVRLFGNFDCWFRHSLLFSLRACEKHFGWISYTSPCVSYA